MMWGYNMGWGMWLGMGISILFNIWDALTQPHTDAELSMTLNLGERIEAEIENVATHQAKDPKA